MEQYRIVTMMADTQALEWGLKPDRIGLPMTVFCTEDVASELKNYNIPNCVHVVPVALPGTLNTAAKLSLIQQACALQTQTEYCYWLNIDYIYTHLSFDYVYSPSLVKLFETVKDDLHYCFISGYPSDALFGGPVNLLNAAAEHYESYVNSLFFESVYTQVEKPKPFKLLPLSEQYNDLNLGFSSITLDVPALHIIGDSHSLFCYTPGSIIGCRSNILCQTAHIHTTAIPYQYQYTHHIGSRTMHHAGRDGHLTTYAKELQVRNGDALVLVFGEIDARSHIMKQHYEHGRDITEVIETLLGNYTRNILVLKQQYSDLNIIVSAPIPPLDNPNYDSETLPVSGSIEERIAVTRQMNALLESSCKNNGIGFINIGDLYETEKGDLRWEISDQFCHISAYHQGPAIERLYGLLSGQQAQEPMPQQAAG